MIVAVRTIRGEMNLSPGIEIPMMLAGGGDDDHDRSLDSSHSSCHLRNSQVLRSWVQLIDTSLINPADWAAGSARTNGWTD